MTGNFTPIYSFIGPPNGLNPDGPVIEGSDGNFYGTTFLGGNCNAGTVYQLTPAGVLTTLHAFTNGANGQSADGSGPEGGLTLGNDGNFYGTTLLGGSSGNGTVFKITPAGVFTDLYSFTGGADGSEPESGLTLGRDGNFYGTTRQGGKVEAGNSGNGTVFQITPAGVLTTLYAFTGGVDGSLPEAALTLGRDGNFYGTTNFGGSNGQGTVFKITPAGVLTTLYSFTGGVDGSLPEAGLTLGSDGNFYGTTYGGGDNNGYGTVFQITPAGVLTTLYVFTGADGENPSAGLVQGSGDNFYGTTTYGGVHGGGTVFQITSAGVLTTLFSFSYGAGGGGYNPQAGLTKGSDGNFYGTTYESSSTDGNQQGTIFMITPAGALSTLYTFSFAGSGGFTPLAGLIQGGDGNFYGTTTSGGADGGGTVFQITPAGMLTILHAFAGGVDGSLPRAGLTLGSDGNFYGTTVGGGVSNGDSTVFKITPAGVLTTLCTFTGGYTLETDNVPQGGLTLGSDGNFYGVTPEGGSAGDGTIFKITPAGVLTTLYTFTGGAGSADPNAGLTEGNDLNFYGTTDGENGIVGDGTVFEITPAGVLTTLYAFTGTDGQYPQAGLIRGSDGNFYGTTSLGGSDGAGTVFQITPAGVLTTLYSFSYGNAGGVEPYSGLTLGSDGNFYGTTSGGGSYDGSIFQITPAGVLTALYTFTGGADGASPFTGLIKASDGSFYGTTPYGGQYGLGVIYRLTVSTIAAAPAVTSGTVTAQVGSAFSFQIVATNSPTSFAASNLPPGLSVDATTGLISGIPTQSGAFTVGLTATNSGGTGSGTLTLTVNPAAPVITSASSASGQAGQAFTYQIAASNAPTSFGASGLPAGLSVDASTGVISGTPTVSGTFNVNLSAANAGGTGTLALTITLAPALPVVSLTAKAPEVFLGSGHVGKFALTLPAPQSAAIIVSFAIKGSAINGVDYQLIKASKKIKAGKTRKIIKIVPLGDLEGASKKVVTLVLNPGDGYTVGTPGKVKVKILAAGQ